MSAGPQPAAVPSFHVRLAASAEEFAAAADQTVLASAVAAGIAMPSSCRTGNCRTCMRQLAAGSVAYRIEWPGLSADEKAEGWFLPCVAYPQSDLEIVGHAARTWWERD